jgi:hypothetical protein
MADLLERLRVALADRYVIERELASESHAAAIGRYVSRADEPGLGGVGVSRASLRTLFSAERALVRARLTTQTPTPV